MSEGQREGWEHCFKEHVLHEKSRRDYNLLSCLPFLGLLFFFILASFSHLFCLACLSLQFGQQKEKVSIDTANKQKLSSVQRQATCLLQPIGYSLSIRQNLIGLPKVKGQVLCGVLQGKETDLIELALQHHHPMTYSSVSSSYVFRRK